MIVERTEQPRNSPAMECGATNGTNYKVVENGDFTMVSYITDRRNERVGPARRAQTKRGRQVASSVLK